MKLLFLFVCLAVVVVADDSATVDEIFLHSDAEPSDIPDIPMLFWKPFYDIEEEQKLSSFWQQLCKRQDTPNVDSESETNVILRKLWNDFKNYVEKDEQIENVAAKN